MLELNGVSAAYGKVEAIHDISFKVGQGEIVALLGSNGAGKTTTLRCISGMIRPRGGSINYRGVNLASMSAERIVELKMRHVPEGRRIFPRLSVDENLSVGAFLMKDRRLIAERREAVFGLFPVLRERHGQKGGTLSGGEQQMLAIGRALMDDPDILLLDEPSMGLAPVLVDGIFEIIQTLNRRGKTILLVEQNARMALEIAHRGYLLQSGRLVLSGSAKELAENPEVRQAYLGGR